MASVESVMASSYFSARSILILMLAINILNCADRFSVGVILDDMKTDVATSSAPSCTSSNKGSDPTCLPDPGQCGAGACLYSHPHCLTSPQLGYVGSVFLIGTTVLSPICAALINRYMSGATMMTGSLLIWALAVVLSGFAQSYELLLVSRTMTGAAEAVYYSIVWPFISAIAPSEHRGRWIAFLAASSAVGAAIGFGSAGVISSMLGWRAVFVTNGVLMVPLALVCTLLPSFDLDDESEETKKDGEEGNSYWEVMQSQLVGVLGNRITMLMILGYTCRVFCSGAWSFWGFDFISHTGLNCNKAEVGLVLGAVMATAGVTGAITGGTAIDYMLKDAGITKVEDSQAMVLYIANRTIAFLAGSCTFFFWVALIPGWNFASFAAVLWIAMFLLLCSDGIISNAVLWSVPNSSKAMSMAVMNILGHALGDVIAGPLIGWVQQSAGDGSDSPDSWRSAFWVSTAWNAMFCLFFVAAFLFSSWRVSDEASAESTALLSAEGKGEGEGKEVSPVGE